MHDPFDDDDPADLTTTAPSARKPEREGLPAGYRMRADAHYVDLLSSRHDRPTADLLRSHVMENGGDNPEPTDRDRVRAQVMARLADGLGAIASASALLAGDATPMARRASIDLIRAESWRAAWLVAAQGLLDRGLHQHQHQPRPRPIGPVLERLRQGFAPECRLSGASLQLSATDWNAIVTVDEPALVAGVTGAIIATFGVLGRLEGAVIKVSAEVEAGELRAIEIAQDDVPVPTSATLRFFDPLWTERPGGWIAGIGAAVAKAAAQQHGGHALLLVAERRGTVVHMTLSRGF